MSTETADTDDELRERISNFLRRNFPQIQMHGGSAAISHLSRVRDCLTVDRERRVLCLSDLGKVECI